MTSSYPPASPKYCFTAPQSYAQSSSSRPVPRWRRPFQWFNTHRTLNLLFTFFALYTLLTGVLMTVLALLWLYPTTSITAPAPPVSLNPNMTGSLAGTSISSIPLSQTVSFLNVVLSSTDIMGALAIGVLFIATTFSAVPAIISREINGLLLLNIGLVPSMLATIAASGMIWYRSLKPRAIFAHIWATSDGSVQNAIQNQWSCCGYWSNNDATSLTGVFPSAMCPSLAVDITKPICVDPFTGYANNLLVAVSTFMFAGAALLAGWFLVNLCIVSERQMQKRFHLIDQKREKMGYV